MASIQDDRGYNQGFKPGKTLTVRTERRCDWMISQMDHLSGKKDILEVGCGTGELSSILAAKTGQQVLGADLCVPFIEEARQKYHQHNLRFEVLDFHEPQQLGERRFDYIVGNGILHHLYHELDSFLPALARWLTPRGRLIFCEPNLINPYIYLIFSLSALRRVAKLEPNEMAFTPRFIRQKLRQAGFERVEITTRDFLLPNTPDFLIRPTIAAGVVLEKIPLVRSLAQSIFLSAQV